MPEVILRSDKRTQSPGGGRSSECMRKKRPGLVGEDEAGRYANKRFRCRYHVLPHNFLRAIYVPSVRKNTNTDTQTRLLDDFTEEIALVRRLSYPLERR